MKTEGKRRSLMEDAELDDWSLHQIRKQYPVYLLMLCKWMNQSPHILLQIMPQGFYLSVPLRSWLIMYWPLTDSHCLFFNTASIHLLNHLSPYEWNTLYAASHSFFLNYFSNLYPPIFFSYDLLGLSTAFLALRSFLMLKCTCVKVQEKT